MPVHLHTMLLDPDNQLRTFLQPGRAQAIQPDLSGGLPLEVSDASGAYGVSLVLYLAVLLPALTADPACGPTLAA